MTAHEQGKSDINISGPCGEVVLVNVPDRPLLMVAGGTGASQAAGFIDYLLVTQPIHDVTILFCADTDSDLYLRPWLENLDVPWLNTAFIADARRTKENRSLIWLSERVVYEPRSLGGSGAPINYRNSISTTSLRKPPKLHS